MALANQADVLASIEDAIETHGSDIDALSAATGFEYDVVASALTFIAAIQRGAQRIVAQTSRLNRTPAQEPLSKRLRMARGERSMGEVASLLGRTAAHIRGIEQGKPPYLADLYIYANEFGAEVSEADVQAAADAAPGQEMPQSLSKGDLQRILAPEFRRVRKQGNMTQGGMRVHLLTHQFGVSTIENRKRVPSRFEAQQLRELGGSIADAVIDCLPVREPSFSKDMLEARMRIGALLATLRDEGVTRPEVALALDRTEPHVYKCEGGESTISVQGAITLHRKFGLTFDAADMDYMHPAKISRDEIPDFLVSLRDAFDLSQRGLAAAIGIDQPQISKVESRAKQPSDRFIALLPIELVD